MREGRKEQPDLFVVGTIIGAHGIRGEVKVMPMTDRPERFSPGAKLLLSRGESADPVEIAGVRSHQKVLLVRLASVSDRNAAELLVGQRFMVSEDLLPPLGEHENYAHDLIGLRVESGDGDFLGLLTEILFTRANDVYVVAGPSGEILIPALQDVVRAVDLAAGKVVVVLPEGLLSKPECAA